MERREQSIMSDVIDENVQENAAENGAEEIVTEKPKGSKKILFVIIGIVSILVVVAAVIFLTPLGKGLLGKNEGAEGEQASSGEKKQEYDITKVEFASLPEILINLRSGDGRSSFLKATFIIECPNEEVSKKVDKIKPLLVDQIQVYLRELEVEDLRGSAGMQRIRQELVTRSNALLNPEKINNILFKEFLVQ